MICLHVYIKKHDFHILYSLADTQNIFKIEVVSQYKVLNNKLSFQKEMKE